MSNISLKLALASIKKEKKQYVISLIVMILSFTIVIAFMNTLKNDDMISQKTREKLYGNWNICYEDIDEQNLKIIKDLKDYKSMTNVEVTAILAHNKQIANYNKDFFQLAAIELTGNVPKNNNEIIVKKQIGKIGETIFLTINDDTKQYKIVGIINDYDQKWCKDAYDYFTYKLTPIHHQTYINASIQSYVQNEANYTLNVLLENSISQLDFQYYLQDSTQFVNYSEVDIGNNDSIMTIDVILVFAIIGLLVGIGYTMAQRKERLLLLKSLGMTNRQVLGYIFYETICLIVCSVVTSFVLGWILSWLMSMTIAYTTGKYYFSFHLLSLLPYIGILILMILAATSLSYLIIAIQSLDSLIHQKTRTKLKKYRQAKKMDVFHLANKEIRHHYVIFLNVIILSSYMLIALTSFIYDSQFTPLASSYELYNANALYSYDFKTNDKINFDREIIEEYIHEYMFYHMYGEKVTIDNEKTQSYKVKDGDMIDTNDITLITYDENIDNDILQICEGRMPENSHECVYIGNGSYSVSYENNEEGEKSYDFSYQIGDKISLVNSSDQLQVEYTVVALAISNDQDSNDGLFGDNFIVWKDSIPQENWSYYYKFYDTKDLQTYFNRNYDNFSLQEHYTSQTYTKSYIQELLYDIVIIIIAIVLLILILKIFIERIMKDLKLLRCLGMTNKQTIQMNLYIFGYDTLIVSGIYYVYIINSSIYIFNVAFRETCLIILMSYPIVMLVIFLLIIHFNLEKDFSFLPADVKRYY